MTLPVFETSRLTLRSITARDAEGLHEAYGDADTMRHWDHPPSRDVSHTAERIRVSCGADPRWHGMWAIQIHTGRFAGAINYHAHNEQQRRLALGWISEEGSLRDWLCVAGEFRSVVMYSLLRSEWVNGDLRPLQQRSRPC